MSAMRVCFDQYDHQPSVTQSSSSNRRRSLVGQEMGRMDSSRRRTTRSRPLAADIGDRSTLKTQRIQRPNARKLLLGVLSAMPTLASADCISMQGSTMCKAFQSAKITNSGLAANLFPFLRGVSNAQNFDDQFRTFIASSYTLDKYQNILGCHNIDISQSDNFYARFTTTVLCNAMIQNSIKDCDLSSDASKPVCADTCAQFAESEAYVSSDSNLCSNPGSNLVPQIRADFTNCALPAGSLSSGGCINGIQNEPDNCGFGNSTIGLCSYCSSGGINSTDTCCYNSNVTSRCAGVVLPTITSTMTFTTPTASATTTPQPVASGSSHGLNGGQIAGIVIGSVVGLLLLALLLILCLRMMRGRRGSQNGSIFNQPSPARKGPSPTGPGMKEAAPQGYEVLPGGRIARMSALEGHSGDSPSHHGAAAAAVGAGAGYIAGRRRGDNHSSSDEFGDSPESEHRGGILRPPPAAVAMRRNGSLSSNSVLGGEDPQSPTSAEGMSSPQGMASQQSEQLPFFKDYYSQDDIHPGDRVAVLWAYQPRAADEFALDRGDMLKVVGIWDDGWATGIMVDERAEDWEARRQTHRDSGVSNTSGRRDASPPASGEIKAFPLVCVCLPEHWRKTIEGDGSTESGSNGNHGPQSTIS